MEREGRASETPSSIVAGEQLGVDVHYVAFFMATLGQGEAAE